MTRRGSGGGEGGLDVQTGMDYDWWRNAYRGNYLVVELPDIAVIG